MNILKLVVGQKTRLQSGDQFREATVREVTEYHTDVKPLKRSLFSEKIPGILSASTTELVSRRGRSCISDLPVVGGSKTVGPSAANTCPGR